MRLIWISSISKAVKFAIAFIAIPTVIFVATKIINRILSDTIMEFVENCLDNVDYLIWSKRTNTILTLISMILVVKIAKWITRLLTQDKDDKDD